MSSDPGTFEHIAVSHGFETPANVTIAGGVVNGVDYN